VPEKLHFNEDALRAALKPGDHSTISNPFMPPTSAFRNENVIYLGSLDDLLKTAR
jgi:hypothetical protein